jgi:hypothetical protein
MNEREVFEMLQKMDEKLDKIQDNCSQRVMGCAHMISGKASSGFVTWAIGLIALFLLGLGALTTSTKIEQAHQGHALTAIAEQIVGLQSELIEHTKRTEGTK